MAPRTRAAVWIVAAVLLALIVVGCQTFKAELRPAGSEGSSPIRAPKGPGGGTAPATVESTPTESVVAESSPAAESAESLPAELPLVAAAGESSAKADESEPKAAEESEAAEKPAVDAEPKPDSEPKHANKPESADEERTRREEKTVEPLPVDETAEPGVVSLKDLVQSYLAQAETDAGVTIEHIQQARTAIEDEKSDETRRAAEQALRASHFLRAGLPTLVAREYLDRAIVETRNGRPKRAIETVKAAASISSRLPLKGTVEQFRRRGALAVKAIEEENPERAREILDQMVRMVDTSDAEDQLDRLSDHLRAAQNALDRDSLRAASAELEGAEDAARTVLRWLREE